MQEVKIYKSEIVNEVESFYGDLLFRFGYGITIHEYLKGLSKRLWQGIKAHNATVQHEINNYHPAYLNGKGNEFFKNHLKKKDARLTIAREFGFRKWKELKKHGRRKFDPVFELSVDLLLNGEIEELENQLMEHPHLVSKKSGFGHRATLLHYTASNGVEIWRQRVPSNLPEIIQLLLDHGADKDAKMYAYRGEFDTLALLESSTHPFDAGVGDRMLEILG